MYAYTCMIYVGVSGLCITVIMYSTTAIPKLNHAWPGQTTVYDLNATKLRVRVPS